MEIKDLKLSWQSINNREKMVRKDVDQFIELLLQSDDINEITEFWKELGKVVGILKRILVEKNLIDNLGDFTLNEIKKEVKAELTLKNKRGKHK